MPLDEVKINLPPLDRAMTYPVPGCYYRHWKGGKVKVLDIGLTEDTKEPVVIYTDDGFLTWVRRLSEWLRPDPERILPSGVRRPPAPRFIRIEK